MRRGGIEKDLRRGRGLGRVEYGEGRGGGKVLRGEGENVREKGWRGDGWRGEGRRVEWARERRTCCGEGKGRVVTLDSFWPRLRRLHNYS